MDRRVHNPPKKLELFLSDITHSDNAVGQMLTESGDFSGLVSYRLAFQICNSHDGTHPAYFILKSRIKTAGM